MNIDKLLKKALGKPKGASVRLQNQWKNFSPKTKTILRKKFPDRDRDGVPNKWDCRPKNSLRQDKAEVDYVNAGFKPVALVNQNDARYAQSLGLFVIQTGQPTERGGFYVSKTKDNIHLKNLKYDDNEKIGAAFGYPKKAVLAHGKEPTQFVFQPRIQYELEGKNTKDLDYLEYVPYGMTYEEAQQDALRRKQATSNPPPLPATHVVNWMTEQKRLHPEMTYEQLEDEWVKLSKEERRQKYNQVY